MIMGDQAVIPIMQIKEEPISQENFQIYDTVGKWSVPYVVQAESQVESTEFHVPQNNGSSNVLLSQISRPVFARTNEQMNDISAICSGNSENLTINQLLNRMYHPYKVETFEQKEMKRPKKNITANIEACLSKYQRIQPAPRREQDAPSSATSSCVLNLDSVTAAVSSKSDTIPPQSQVLPTEQNFTMFPIQPCNGPIVMPLINQLVPNSQRTIIPYHAQQTETQTFSPIQHTQAAQIVNQGQVGMILTQACIQENTQSFIGQNASIAPVYSQTSINSIHSQNNQIGSVHGANQSMVQFNSSVYSQPPITPIQSQNNQIGNVHGTNQSMVQLNSSVYSQASSNILVPNTVSSAVIHNVTPTSICNVITTGQEMPSGLQVVSGSVYNQASKGVLSQVPSMACANTANISTPVPCTENVLNHPTLVTIPAYNNMIPVSQFNSVVTESNIILKSSSLPKECTTVNSTGSSAESISCTGSNSLTSVKQFITELPEAHANVLLQVPSQHSTHNVQVQPSQNQTVYEDKQLKRNVSEAKIHSVLSKYQPIAMKEPVGSTQNPSCSNYQATAIKEPVVDTHKPSCSNYQSVAMREPVVSTANPSCSNYQSVAMKESVVGTPNPSCSNYQPIAMKEPVVGTPNLSCSLQIQAPCKSFHKDVWRQEEASHRFQICYKNYHLCKVLSAALLRASSRELKKVLRDFNLIKKFTSIRPIKPLLNTNGTMELVKALLDTLHDTVEHEEKVILSRTTPILYSLRRIVHQQLGDLDIRLFSLFKKYPFLKSLAKDGECTSRNIFDKQAESFLQPPEEFLEVLLEPNNHICSIDGYAKEENELPHDSLDSTPENVFPKEEDLNVLLEKFEVSEEIQKCCYISSHQKSVAVCRNDCDESELRSYTIGQVKQPLSCPVCSEHFTDLWLLYRHLGNEHLSVVPSTEPCFNCGLFTMPNKNRNVWNYPLGKSFSRFTNYRCYKCFKHLGNKGQLLKHRAHCNALTLGDLKRKTHKSNKICSNVL